MSRYTFEFNDELDETLSQLASKKSITKADVLRRAIASYSYLTKEAAKNEQKVSITNEADHVVKDVILP